MVQPEPLSPESEARAPRVDPQLVAGQACGATDPSIDGRFADGGFTSRRVPSRRRRAPPAEGRHSCRRQAALLSKTGLPAEGGHAACHQRIHSYRFIDMKEASALYRLLG